MGMPTRYVERASVVGAERRLCVPLRPNFIYTTRGEQIAIADLSDAELKAIGQGWTRELIADADRRRKRKGGTDDRRG